MSSQERQRTHCKHVNTDEAMADERAWLKSTWDDYSGPFEDHVVNVLINLRDEATRDYTDMRRFQAKYIEADHELSAQRHKLMDVRKVVSAGMPGANPKRLANILAIIDGSA